LVPLNHADADLHASGQSAPCWRQRKRLVGNVIKFPNEGRIVRFGRDAAEESATIIILPVIRIERYMDSKAEGAEPQTHPPAQNGGRRRLRRR
jgi:hypothetical protein